MIEILAYAAKLLGVLFLVIAAVGVLRLPDAFTRMHAATKAGTLGAGLVVLGSALSLRGPEAIGLALVTLAILLATVPLASHLLARAAYTSGAPFWRGTARDALEGTLARGERPGTETGEAPPPEPMAIERIVVAPAHGAEGASVRRAGQLAEALGRPVLGLGMIDMAGLADGAARATARARLEAKLVRLREAIDIPPDAIITREGVPEEIAAEALRPGDLLVVPAIGWYDHGAGTRDRGVSVLEESDPRSGRAETTLALARRLPRPILIASGRESVGRIVVLDDGSPEIARALATLDALRPFPDASVRVTWPTGEGMSPARRALLTRAAGALDLGFQSPAGGLVRGSDDLLVCRRVPGPARGDWYGTDWRERIAEGWRGGVLLV